MRAKSFLLLLGCIVATSTLVCLYGDPKPALDGLVSETHRQLSNLKNLKVGPEQREPQELERYLSHLGLSPPSPAPSRSPTSGPGAVPAVVGTATGPDQVARLAGFLEACQAHFPDHPVVVYALDLGTVDLLQAQNLCNSSNCTLRTLNFDFYPAHVSNLKIYAYRPIIIQELLRQAGAVLWLEPDYQLTAAPDPRRVVGRALREGLAAPWSPEPQPTSALTHLGMFEYLGAPREAFFFHRMVDPSVMLLFDSPQVRYVCTERHPGAPVQQQPATVRLSGRRPLLQEATRRHGPATGALVVRWQHHGAALTVAAAREMTAAAAIPNSASRTPPQKRFHPEWDVLPNGHFGVSFMQRCQALSPSSV